MSLVRRMGAADGNPRFGMLETIREFAVECLHQNPEEMEAVGQAHARWFLQQATALGDVIRLKGDPPSLNRLSAEYDNLRATLAWFVENREAESLAQLTEVLSWFWQLTAYEREGRQWLERALRLSTTASPRSRMQLLVGAAIMVAEQGDHARARALAEELLS